MSPSEIIHIISEKYTPLSPECTQALLPKLKIASYAKGEVLVREGQYSSQVSLGSTASFLGITQQTLSVFYTFN